MKPSTVVATLLAGIAVGTGSYGLVKSQGGGDSATAQAPAPPPSTPRVEQSVQPKIKHEAAKQPTSSELTVAAAAGGVDSRKKTPSSQIEPQPLSDEQTAAALTHDDLLARAQRVEQEANHELRRLVPLLGLSEEQQDQVFAALAARSPSFVPGMRMTGAGTDATSTAAAPTPILPFGDNTLTTTKTGTGGEIQQTAPDAQAQPSATTDFAVVDAPLTTTNGAPEISSSTAPLDLTESLIPYLTEDQADTLAQDESDQVAWWDEVVGDLITNTGITVELDGSTTPDTSTLDDGRPTTLEEERPTTLEEDRPTTLDE